MNKKLLFIGIFNSVVLGIPPHMLAELLQEAASLLGEDIEELPPDVCWSVARYWTKKAAEVCET